MRNWRKIALKSDHGNGLQRERKKKYGAEQEEDAISGIDSDPVENVLTEMAVYFESRMQEEIRAIQHEMEDVNIPPQLYTKLEKMAGGIRGRESFFSDKKRLRVMSAMCALFLTAAVGAGILISPQSDDLKDALYGLITDPDMLEEDNGISADENDRGAEYSGSEEADRSGSAGNISENQQISTGRSGNDKFDASEMPEKNDDSHSDDADAEADSGLWNNDQTDGNADDKRTETGGDPGENTAGNDQSGGNSLFPSIQPIDADPASFPENLEKVYYPSYLPEGYRRTFVSEDGYMDIVFENYQQQTMITLQYDMDGSSGFYESAAEGGSNVSVNGNKGVLYYRNLLNIGSGQKVVCWEQNGVSLRVQCAAANVSDSEIMQIAESVSLKDTESVASAR